MRTYAPALTLLLAACPSLGPDLAADADRGDFPDTDYDPTLPETDDDSDPAHSDAPDHSDPVPIDDSDTFDPADTNDTGLDPRGPVHATIPNVHAGIYNVGDLLLIHDVVVTAVRAVRMPPASNAFVVQTRSASRNAGLYVHVRNTTSLPSVGDVVTIVGVYEEIGSGSPRLGTISRLTIHPSLAGTSFTITGVDDLPEPELVDLATLAAPAAAEVFESMLVRVETPGSAELTVMGPPSARYGDFPVSLDGGATEVDVVTWFYDLRQHYSPSAGDTISSITGIAYWEGSDFNLAPRSATDAVGFIER